MNISDTRHGRSGSNSERIRKYQPADDSVQWSRKYDSSDVVNGRLNPSNSGVVKLEQAVKDINDKLNCLLSSVASVQLNRSTPARSSDLTQGYNYSKSVDWTTRTGILYRSISDIIIFC